MPKHVAQDWYECRALRDGVSRIHEIHIADWLRCNIWHVRGRDRDLIIDTGMGLRPLTREIALLSERPITAIMTHSHFDHAGGMHEFSDRCGHRSEAAIIADPTAANTVADAGYVRAETFSALPYEGFTHEHYRVRPAPLTRLLDEGDVIDLGDRVFKVFHLPGHSPGSIALYEKATEILFSGDVVYDGALIDDLYHSDPDLLHESHTRLKELPVATIHGGHFPSFGRDRMIDLIDEYNAGGLRIGDASAWIEGEMGNDTSDAKP
ncbi:MBL fold metallo-hydrolase [Roseovarius aestuarii]|uniref:Hydroxyacylglutathione hydrolase n=1 Tax=Roseovarius aestuarii TaxID=475083 RepID=A0A1X7BP83_9RHOB|nr:MBL fold metallo-hydrolase [Roseovarius aestuarii]SMC11401.1 hydroxyacylglutathione hydrolase [Roseovarius aestuarii]